MYDMYPEWGPAKNRLAEDPTGSSSVQTALDMRDNGGERPDDN